MVVLTAAALAALLLVRHARQRRAGAVGSISSRARPGSGAHSQQALNPMLAARGVGHGAAGVGVGVGGGSGGDGSSHKKLDAARKPSVSPLVTAGLLASPAGRVGGGISAASNASAALTSLLASKRSFGVTQVGSAAVRAVSVATDDDPLPAGWTAHVSRSSKKTYFVHTDGRTAWTRPRDERERDGAAPPLPAGWTAKQSKSTGKTYFVSDDGQTAWERPTAPSSNAHAEGGAEAPGEAPGAEAPGANAGAEALAVASAETGIDAGADAGAEAEAPSSAQVAAEAEEAALPPLAHGWQAFWSKRRQRFFYSRGDETTWVRPESE